ncbi:hypothetical protein HW132_08230 [Brasilonema sp. CT11]|nr:hypothetical protein [Brasilonema sp. CT11]
MYLIKADENDAIAFWFGSLLEHRQKRRSPSASLSGVLLLKVAHRRLNPRFAEACSLRTGACVYRRSPDLHKFLEPVIRM